MNKKKQMIRNVVTIFVVMLGLNSGNVVQADSKKEIYSVARVSSGGPVVSEKSSFFDLKMKPGETRTITAKIKNGSLTDSIRVKNRINTAFTNTNGEIDYSSMAEKYDESLKIKLTDITEIPASSLTPTIPKGKSEEVKAEISVPKDAKEGVILGSWYFDKEGQNDSSEKSGGVKINSKQTYSIAIKITIGSEIKKPNLNLISVTKGLINYRKAFFANVQNDQPALVTNLEFDGYVTKKGSLDILYKNKLVDRSMAPNSNYGFPVLLEQDQFKQGEYTYHLTATTTDTKWEKKTWEWTKDFTVLSDEANKLNKQAINDLPPKKDNMLFIIGGIVLVLLLLFFLIFFLLKRKRKKEEEDEMVDEMEKYQELLERKRHRNKNRKTR